MEVNIVNGDISDACVDAIINASNGIGFMSGFIGRYIKVKGVAETLHFKSKGKIEKEARIKARKYRWVPAIIFGKNSGHVFVTSAYSLNATYIFHAVTMYFPGTISSIKTIKKLLPEIMNLCKEYHVKSIAIPLLGTGVGRLKKETVMQLYLDYFKGISDEIEISIYDLTSN